MKSYELMVVISGQIPEDLAKDFFSKVKKIIEEHKGKITADDFWGRRKLAYKIKKNDYGYYGLLVFEVEPSGLSAIESDVSLVNEVIRHLLSIKEVRKIKEKKKKKETQKTEELEKKTEAKEVKSEKIESKKTEDKKKSEEVGLRPIARSAKKPREETLKKEVPTIAKGDVGIPTASVGKEKIETEEEAKEEKAKKVAREIKESGEKEEERIKELDKKLDAILHDEDIE